MDMADQGKIKLHPSWCSAIGEEFDKPYMAQLREFLMAQKTAGKIIYPPASQWFGAFDTTPFDKVRVVILGAGSLPWARSGSRPVLLGIARCQSASFVGQYL